MQAECKMTAMNDDDNNHANNSHTDGHEPARLEDGQSPSDRGREVGIKATYWIGSNVDVTEQQQEQEQQQQQEEEEEGRDGDGDVTISDNYNDKNDLEPNNQLIAAAPATTTATAHFDSSYRNSGDGQQKQRRQRDQNEGQDQPQRQRFGLPAGVKNPVKPEPGSTQYSGMHDQGPLPCLKEGGPLAGLLNNCHNAKTFNDEFMTQQINKRQTYK